MLNDVAFFVLSCKPNKPEVQEDENKREEARSVFCVNKELHN